jgi:3-oxoacyl-[acyl-carrier-protein] synthase II
LNLWGQNLWEMSSKIVIGSIGSVSALGGDHSTVIRSLQDPKPVFQIRNLNKEDYPVFSLHPAPEKEINDLLKQHPKLKKADRTVHLAVLAADKCLAGYPHKENTEWIINAGSSRGATGVWENFHKEFLSDQNIPVKSSPLTTLGNISTHVAQHQKMNGFNIDHSITCGSGLQALANAFAWLRSGLADHFLAIGTEAPITDFTIGQMSVLGIYSNNKGKYPCLPCAVNADSTNSFCLGEAAVAIALITKEDPEAGSIVLAGMGTASEMISNPTSISPNGEAFTKGMEKALENAGIQPREIDIVIPHSPGTYQGDQAELKAIQNVFAKDLPKVINHKFLTGHTLGASGLLSVELAYYFLTENLEFEFPYPAIYSQKQVKSPKIIMINSMGFGGNSVSIILKKI